MGHEATEVYVNNIWLQSAWAREHGAVVPQPPSVASISPIDSDQVIMKLKRKLRRYKRYLAPLARHLGYIVALSATQRRILEAQIEQLNPDIILNQIPEVVTGEVLLRAKRPGRAIIVQHGNQPPDNFDPRPYTFGISLIPSVVEFFKSRGLPAEQRHLAFDASVINRLGPSPDKDLPVTFVGGLSSNHVKRVALLEAISCEMPIDLYLSGLKGLPADSSLHDHSRGEVWGRDMYNILRRSKITLNSHIDAAKGMAGNVRLYEATGVGTFLLTDNLPNLPTLFQPGIHVATYNSAEDCVAKIKYYLAHDAEREMIARAGQQHTLAHHSYRQRVVELIELVEKYSK